MLSPSTESCQILGLRVPGHSPGHVAHLVAALLPPPHQNLPPHARHPQSSARLRLGGGKRLRQGRTRNMQVRERRGERRARRAEREKRAVALQACNRLTAGCTRNIKDLIIEHEDRTQGAGLQNGERPAVLHGSLLHSALAAVSLVDASDEIGPWASHAASSVASHHPPRPYLFTVLPGDMNPCDAPASEFSAAAVAP